MIVALSSIDNPHSAVTPSGELWSNQLAEKMARITQNSKNYTMEAMQ